MRCIASVQIERVKLKYFVPGILCGIAILVLSIAAGIKLPKVAGDLISPDKLAHAAAYVVFCSTLIFGFHRNQIALFRTLGISLAISVGYGILMEILQYSFFPYRYFEVWDIVANIIGSIISVLVSYFIIK